MRVVLPAVFAVTAIAFGANAQTREATPVASLQPPPGMEVMCRANGNYFHVGARVCIRSAYGPQLATCGRVQNVLNWELSGASCEPASVQN